MHRFEASVVQGLKSSVACEHTQLQVTSVPATRAQGKATHDNGTPSSDLDLPPAAVTTKTPRHPPPPACCASNKAHTPVDLLNDDVTDNLSCLFYQNDS